MLSREERRNGPEASPSEEETLLLRKKKNIGRNDSVLFPNGTEIKVSSVQLRPYSPVTNHVSTCLGNIIAR